jgi:uncharacterized protein YoxC
MDVLTVFEIILLAAASCLCVALIIYLRKIASSFDGLQQEIKHLSDRLKPLIVSTTELSEKLHKISDELKEPVEKVKDIVTNVKERVDQILLVEEKIRGGFENSVSGMIKNLSSVANGVSTFWKTFRKNNQ